MGGAEGGELVRQGALPPGRGRHRLRRVRPARPAGRRARRSRARAGRRGARALHRRPLWSGAPVASPASRYRDSDGDEHEVAAKFVIGADGRRSPVAAMVGSWDPYRVSRNGRGLVFRYMDDPQAGTDAARDLLPVPRGRVDRLRIPHDARGAPADPDDGSPRRGVGGPQGPRGLLAAQARPAPHAAAQRQEGATNLTKMRSTGETPAFFRASSGPGLGAGRGRRSLQGPGDRAGNA